MACTIFQFITATHQYFIHISSMNLMNLNLMCCQDIQVLALAETLKRHDVPGERFVFDGYQAWHSDRGGQNKVRIFVSTTFICVKFDFSDYMICPLQHLLRCSYFIIKYVYPNAWVMIFLLLGLSQFLLRLFVL